MSSEGKSERRRPSSPVCWLLQLLVPESLMFSEPETLSAGPPGPSRLWILDGSGDGNWNDSPVRAAGAFAALVLEAARVWSALWVHCRRKLSRALSAP